MADPVKQPDPASAAAKPKPPAPKAKAPAPEAKPAPKAAKGSSLEKGRMTPLDVNLGRTGRRMESALPVVKPKPKPVPKAAPKGAPAAKGAPVAKGAPAKPAAKKAPRAKKHYFILENLCVGCGLCLDKCPPKVNAIGYKFYGDVQEGGFRCYIDQDACISCSACFSSDECPSGALIEILPEGDVLDFSYTPPERLDFDLRFLHRFHKENR
ncbi:4Fe-4S ferredoxin [Prosthecochloris sp. GSB1]|uniref:indolepyruvate ferredoxin oxidoreductase subunit alpha n=1 Tax=Prosthecochloris sp. GSB1 TaxID=281093 RepID=UPI000B8D0F73|nr:4Fe-4S dicluster domain-containing protein [Prosthecochloris sp. GSB1]ASQ89752.1 4Fe-4S ferredoxin [Prosthecochloris sp. GSB1]